MKNLRFILLFCCGYASAQPTTFFKTYEGISSNSLALTSDGGYILTGRNKNLGPTDILLLKTDEKGDTIWTKTYGGLHSDEGFDVIQTFDSGYVIAAQIGEPDTFSELLSDIFVIKTNSIGEVIWTYEQQNPDWGDRAYSVKQNPDSSLIVSGAINERVNGGRPMAFLLKLSSAGERLWFKTYGDFGSANSVIPTYDGGYLFVGAGYNIVKTDSEGEIIWNNVFERGWGTDGIQNSDSSFTFTGIVFDNSPDAFLTKVSKKGNWEWTKYFGGNEIDYTSSLAKTADGGYILAGETQSFSTGMFTNSDIWLIRTDHKGDTLWTRSYGFEQNDISTDVVQHPDGGLIITGRVNNNSNIFLLKTDSLGLGTSLTTTNNLPVSKSIEFETFPNPVTDELEIQFNKPPLHDFLLELYNIDGSLLQKIKFQKMQLIYSVPFSGFNSGTYFYKIVFPDGKDKSGRFLKVN